VPTLFPLQLTARRMLTATTAHLNFVRADGQPLDFIPGQFIQLHIPCADGSLARRSFSLATRRDHALGPGEAVEITAGFVPGGLATTLLEHLPIGGTVQASGPFGQFRLHANDGNRRYWLIATGTGVAPYRAMLPQLDTLMTARAVDATLLLGVRTPDDVLYGDELRAFADAHPQFRFIPCFSRTLPAPGTPQHHREMYHGYVQQYLAGAALSAEDDIAYLCGNPQMVDACLAVLRAAGFRFASIRREKYLAGQ